MQGGPGPIEVLYPKDWKDSSSLLSDKKSSTTSNYGLHQHITSSQQATSKLNKDVSPLTTSTLLEEHDLTSDLIPSRYKNKMDTVYVSGIRTQHSQYVQSVRENSNNLQLRCMLSQSSLLQAEFLRALKQQIHNDPSKLEDLNKKEIGYLENAKKEIPLIKELNAFHALPYYTESMIKEYEGINCTDICKVKEYIQLLKAALVLDSEDQELKGKVQATLQKTVEFLRARWEILKKEETIDSDTYQDWLGQLDRCLSQDALEVLFTDHPELFQLAKQAKYSAFFNQHPEFKSIEAFLNKHPSAGIIKFAVLNKESLHAALAQAESNPLAQRLSLVSQEAVLTPVVANEIKDGMLNSFEKGKILKVYVGNKDDLYTIVNSFKNDESLAPGHGSIQVEEAQAKNSNSSFYILAINPDKPFIKA